MDEMDTKDPSVAVELLLGKALDAVPYISEAQVLNGYRPLKSAWGSRFLFLGNSAETKNLILLNLKELAEIKEFEKFVIRVYDDLVCAQVMAIFSTDTFTGVRVWHSNSTIYTCGNSAFHQ